MYSLSEISILVFRDHIFGVELKYRRMRKYTQTYTPLVSLTVLLGMFITFSNAHLSTPLLPPVDSLYALDKINFLIDLDAIQLSKNNL